MSTYSANETYKVQISLKGAELLCAKILWKNRIGEFSNIKDAKCRARIGPADHMGVIKNGFVFNQLGFAIQHLVQSTRELLRHTSFSGARKGEVSKRAHLTCACRNCRCHFNSGNGNSCRLMVLACRVRRRVKSVGMMDGWNAFQSNLFHNKLLTPAIKTCLKNLRAYVKLSDVRTTDSR